jgi:outer membrane lipoprotein SlyB
MKKIISAIAVIGALALAGCGNNNNSGTGEETATPATNNVTGVSMGVSNGAPSMTITNNTATNNTP